MSPILYSYYLKPPSTEIIPLGQGGETLDSEMSGPFLLNV